MFTVVALAFEGMSALHLSIPCAVFAEAGRARVMVASSDPSPLSTTAGVGLTVTQGLAALEAADLVVVPTWVDVTRAPSAELVAALRAARSRGASVMGLCLGAYALAGAGLLDGREATTHWAYAGDFATRFPTVRLDARRLYVEADGVWTSAARRRLDCCLAYLRARLGGEAANAAARMLVAAPHRTGGQAQFIARPTPARREDERLAALLDEMRARPEAPWRLDALARRAGMSRRSFTRLFQATTGESFLQWLLAERVRLAQTLLETSRLPVEEVASQAGFGSTAALRAHFTRLAGTAPSMWRTQFRRAI
ncbi:MAG: helix-turn-helix domain-containing protein [Rhodoblastus sp.]|nr:MAG: helix-turn-helix domain-containing protein [Rhodoblastus sp.]